MDPVQEVNGLLDTLKQTISDNTNQMTGFKQSVKTKIQEIQVNIPKLQQYLRSILPKINESQALQEQIIVNDQKINELQKILAEQTNKINALNAAVSASDSNSQRISTQLTVLTDENNALKQQKQGIDNEITAFVYSIFITLII